MPTLTCAACQALVDVPLWDEPEPLSSPDLDTRPGAPLRETIVHWLQLCPACGYAAPDLTQAPTDILDVLATPAYRAETNPFLRQALLLEHLGHHADAGWSALQAAWLHDDRAESAEATAARRRALQLWQRGKSEGQSFLDTPAQEFALVADLLRRAGQWDEARQCALLGLEEPELPPVGEDLLRFQLALIGRRDSEAHNMAELPPTPPEAHRFRFNL